MFIGYPSDDFPAPPHVAMELPEGWEGLHLPDTVLAIREPEVEGSFMANVVVRARHHRTAPASEMFEALTAETAEHELRRVENFDDETPGLYRVVGSEVEGHQLVQQHLMLLVEQPRTSLTLSLIHISEPTRPY